MSRPIDRKQFLLQSSLRLSALAAGAFVGPGLLRFAFAKEREASDELLVCVFLRGGYDGLSLVPPLAGDDRAEYEAARPSLKIPIEGAKAALKLDDRFGLHPGAGALHKLFTEKKLAIVHACGQATNSRSHFDAQTYMELGTPDRKDTPDGWLTRRLEAAVPKPSFLTAVAVGSLVPQSLQAYREVAVINNLGGFNLGAFPRMHDSEKAALAKLYSGRSWLDQSAHEALGALDAVETREKASPPHEADFPKSEIGSRLETLLRLIEMDQGQLGLRAAAVDMGGWDTHKFQGPVDGHFATLVEQLSESLATFHRALGARKHTILVMSEFGRRLKENANHGTDHGHGNVMLVLGSQVRGGKVYGEWPGLKTEHLYERADLAVTTDYREVVAEVLRSPKLFPGFTPKHPLSLINQ